MMKHRIHSLVFFGTVLFAAGCGHTSLEIPLVPNPVMLGPVDRIGGHQATNAPVLQSIEGEVDDQVYYSQGSNIISFSRTSTKSAAVARNVLVATHGRPDRDVRVQKLSVGAWGTVGAGTVWFDRWAGMEANVVEVRHDR